MVGIAVRRRAAVASSIVPEAAAFEEGEGRLPPRHRIAHDHCSILEADHDGPPDVSRRPVREAGRWSALWLCVVAVRSVSGTTFFHGFGLDHCVAAQKTNTQR